MTAAVPATRWVFWAGAAAAFLLALWLLNDILLPFVVGAVVAYFFDPVVTRLQHHGLSRTWATTAVTVLAALFAIGAAMAILPPLYNQVQSLVLNAPQYAVKAVARVQPMVEPLRERFGLPPVSLHDLQAEATQRRARRWLCSAPLPPGWHSGASPSSICLVSCS
jgi:predicted PurR-regulated permease PerM